MTIRAWISALVIVRHCYKLHALRHVIHYNPIYLGARLRRRVSGRKCVTNQAFLIKISHRVRVIARILYCERVRLHLSIWCIYVRESDVVHHVFVAGCWFFDERTAAELLWRLNRLCTNVYRICVALILRTRASSYKNG